MSEDSSDEPETKTLADLIAVMAALRTPVTGCPWDLEQDFATIAPYTIEEAYEVADAIARRDMVDLQEELGDLLLQVVYHARLAEEEGTFTFADVADGITRKMIRRHPHVFGDAEARSAGMAKGAWERIKAEEKKQKAAARAKSRSPAQATSGADRSGEVAKPPSALDDVPVGMPALTRAVKLQEKAARVGFDWPSLAPVLSKLKEELAELEQTLDEPLQAMSGSSQQREEAARAAIEEEYGDLLFVMANLARHLKLDPEATLRRANDKFTRRFRYVEARLAERNKTPAGSTLEEMDAVWNEVRSRDKG
jgi:ATP diphosphatase